jgi:undecaprenyl-diphosphatase
MAVGRLQDKLHDAAIETHPAQRRRAAVFQVYALLGSVGFIALAIAAHFIPYFPIDLRVTRALQIYHGAAFDAVMRAESWMGFAPQTIYLGGAVLVTLFAAGLRREAVAAFFASLGSVAGIAIKLVVYRPRPSADLVHVLRPLADTGFPSGHVLTATAFGGFLGFLVYTMIRQSGLRTAALTLIGFGVLLMGPSRIYLGQHWFSDVMGAYVLGSLWLALSIKLYRRLKAHAMEEKRP